MSFDMSWKLDEETGLIAIYGIFLVLLAIEIALGARDLLRKGRGE